MRFSTYGGLLMFLTGILYLMFEDAIIGHSSASRGAGKINSLGSRVIMGMQVRDPICGICQVHTALYLY